MALPVPQLPRGREYAVERSDEPAVLQKVVDEWVQSFPDAREGYAEKSCMVDLDPFLIRGRLAGFMCRLSQRAPVNVAQGAHLVPVFVSSGVDL